QMMELPLPAPPCPDPPSRKPATLHQVEFLTSHLEHGVQRVRLGFGYDIELRLAWLGRIRTSGARSEAPKSQEQQERQPLERRFEVETSIIGSPLEVRACRARDREAKACPSSPGKTLRQIEQAPADPRTFGLR